MSSNIFVTLMTVCVLDCDRLIRHFTWFWYAFGHFECNLSIFGFGKNAIKIISHILLLFLLVYHSYSLQIHRWWLHFSNKICSIRERANEIVSNKGSWISLLMKFMTQKIGMIVFRLFRCDYFKLHPFTNNAIRSLQFNFETLSVKKAIKTTEKIIDKTVDVKIINKTRHWPLYVETHTFFTQLRSNRYWLIDMPMKIRTKTQKTKTKSHSLNSMFPHRLNTNTGTTECSMESQSAN